MVSHGFAPQKSPEIVGISTNHPKYGWQPGHAHHEPHRFDYSPCFATPRPRNDCWWYASWRQPRRRNPGWCRLPGATCATDLWMKWEHDSPGTFTLWILDVSCFQSPFLVPDCLEPLPLVLLQFFHLHPTMFHLLGGCDLVGFSWMGLVGR